MKEELSVFQNLEFGEVRTTLLDDEPMFCLADICRLGDIGNSAVNPEIAKELNLRSATQLNRILADKKIQYSVNGTWVMYSQYSDLGYEEIKQEVMDSGRVIYHRRITQLGREFILGLLEGERLPA